jgi:uncharacterized protein
MVSDKRGTLHHSNIPSRNPNATLEIVHLLPYEASMPRKLLKKITPHPHTLRTHKLVKLLGPKVAHPGLWSLQRRAVSGALATGLAVSFIPLPIHLPLAGLIAVIWHFNIPTLALALLIVNPFTAVPIYYAAYRVGALALGYTPQPFDFELSFAWLQNGLGPIWRPFLVGCLICSVLSATLAWLLLETIWRCRVIYKYRHRRRSVV